MRNVRNFLSADFRKLEIDPNKVDAQKLSTALEKLESLGVYHNGEIICPAEIDAQVMEIMDSLII